MMGRDLLSIAELEKRIDYVFKNKKLLERAVTHRSFSAEHNERLEFLGDSVLNCVVGYALFLRDRHFDEGVLSRVRANFVCEKTLDEIADEIEISRFIRLGEGELKTGGAKRPSIIADACEAIFGAVFLDGGFEESQRVILKLYDPILNAKSMTPERLSKDAKTLLQEALQGNHLALPEYKITRITGAAHKQHFYCSCRIEKFSIVTAGDGKSRREAEQVCAQKALELLKDRLKPVKKK